MIVHVVRIAVTESFQCFVFLIFLSLHGIDAHLGKRQSLTVPFQCLHQVQGSQHLVIVLLLVIELQQDIQHIETVFVVGIQSFVGVHRLIELSGVDMCNGQSFQIRVVAWVQVSRLLHARQRHRVVIQLRIIGCLCVVNLCRLRIDGLAVLQQVEGCCELPLILQVLSLKEEVFQSLGVVEGKRGARSVE